MTKHHLALAAVLLLAGCANKQGASTQGLDQRNEGIAKTCTPSVPELNASASASATITMTNDGWCAVRTSERDGKPYQLGPLKSRPEHGRVLIQPVNAETRIEYTPDPRFVGTDRFNVALRSRTPGTPDATVQVAVTVSMGEGMAPEPAPAVTTRTPARTPTKAPAKKPATR